MTPAAARKILDLGPGEDPRPYLADFKLARERIAALVRSEADPALAGRYQEGLIEFDQALAVIREDLAARGLVFPPPPTTRLERPTAPALVAATAAAGKTSGKSPAPRRRALVRRLWLVLFLTGSAAGVWHYYQNAENLARQRQARIALLEREGSGFVENRRWQEAARAYAEIDTLAPGSELARHGRRRIEAGMTEEQSQFIGYWTGQAIAELDAGRMDPAQNAIQRVLEKFPAEPEAIAILARIAAGRTSQASAAALLAARQQLDARQWDAAITACGRILAAAPDNQDARAILADASAARDQHLANQARAHDLLAKAIARDQGQFDPQALDWLREAATLAPDVPEIAAKLEKMAAYTRTLRVPGDFATPAEALAAARDRDRIILAEKTWHGTLVVNTAVELQGAGCDKTIVECPAAEGCPITIGPAAKGVRISGITFRHAAFLVGGSERFSAALVRGGGATFVDCRFSGACGHGLVVIEQGTVTANRCRFTDNGWNGAAANGKGCVLEVRDCAALNNFEHGIESWAGATATLVNNRCEGNSRNGIHADNGAAGAIIEGNQLIANREFGLVLDSAGSGTITANTARANLLGGLVIRAAAAALPVTGNQVTLNQGPGLVLESGLDPASYAANTVTHNTPRQILTGADLSRQQEPAKAPSNIRKE